MLSHQLLLYAYALCCPKGQHHVTAPCLWLLTFPPPRAQPVAHTAAAHSAINTGCIPQEVPKIFNYFHSTSWSSHTLQQQCSLDWALTLKEKLFSGESAELGPWSGMLALHTDFILAKHSTTSMHLETQMPYSGKFLPPTISQFSG